MLSVIIPTFNEALNIASLISHIQGCDQASQIEIIVVDSPQSNDEGYRLAKGMGVVALKSDASGRAAQMNHGAAKAKHDLLYFLHADVRPPKNFISSILNQVSSGYQMGIFSYHFDNNNLMLRINAFFTNFDGLFAGGGDQSLFILKSDFKNLNGFNENLLIMEDFDFFKRGKSAKLRRCIIKNPVIVSARKYASNSWLKVNITNLRIFLIYLSGGSQEKMIHLNKKLTFKKVIKV